MNDLETQLQDRVVRGRITVGDADAVREFARFLADPRVGKVGPLHVDVLREYQDLLGLTTDQINAVEEQRAMRSDIPEKTDPEVTAGAAAIGRLRTIFQGVLPDDIEIARVVLASATKARRESAIVTPGNEEEHDA